jgi:hypothetical protein
VALSGLLTVTTAGYLVGHLLVCLAAPLFLRRIGELTAVPVVVNALTVPALVLVCGAFVVSVVGGAVPVVLGAGSGRRPGAVRARPVGRRTERGPLVKLLREHADRLAPFLA